MGGVKKGRFNKILVMGIAINTKLPERPCKIVTEAKHEIKNPVRGVQTQQVIRTTERLTIIGGHREAAIKELKWILVKKDVLVKLFYCTWNPNI